MEEKLAALYEKDKSAYPPSSPPSVEYIDLLARRILTEYSKTMEDKATDEAFLKSFFAQELKIPSDSKLMQLTIERGKDPIRKIVSEYLGYLYSDYPRERLREVLRHDYPEQVDKVSYLINIWSKNQRKFAPIWEQ